MITRRWAALALCIALARPAWAQPAALTIGVTLGVTGPAASLGIPEQNAVQLMPKEIDGTPVTYIALDDGADPGRAVRNARQLIEQYKVDAIIGSTSIPASMAVADVALQTRTPQLALVPMPTNDYSFSLPQSAELMAAGLVEEMVRRKVGTVAYVGFADSLGDQNFEAFNRLAVPAGLKVVANERFARTDTSVAAQILKVLQSKPDAVFVSASGAPAALPAIELKKRGYKGQIYFLHGVILPTFLRVGGRSVEGAIATSAPFAVAEELPDSDPVKAKALAFKQMYEKVYGPGTADTFASYAWDAYQLIANALPAAKAEATPGTPEFRAALKKHIETAAPFAGADAIYAMTPSNHNGLSEEARVMVRIEDGAFRVLPPQ